MNKSDILDHLIANQDHRGIAHWENHAETSGGLKSYGIGLTKLRKFAKSVGRDAALANELWASDVYEMKIISLLIDDPKSMSIEQAESQVEHLQGGYLAHVFSSCDATLAKTPFVVELADRWIASDDAMRKCCGYGLLYEISKNKKKSAPDEVYFLNHIARIGQTHSKQPTDILMSMATALMGMGKRTRALNEAALKVAEAIGPIDFDPNGRCDPYDVAKHLKSDFILQKLAD
ncbi:MAG: DNA alkylation repair protein [Paracoccaceae bacterium]|jgi:3-methyladenine DNA glycosylase AlkD|nr:DNA alkylation repair protein [Paracoccaceae bacterium]MDP7184792.1 DNA alkylation repair protein [Paracoccaceae bacterium]